jgi:hypothetical protein
MTDDELRALVAENSVAIRELRSAQEESSRKWEIEHEQLRASREESERRWLQSQAELERQREESERRWQQSLAATERHAQESERLWQEIQASRRETDRLITSFNRQLGELGNKLGDYTESLFRPSLERALREQLGMTVIASPLRVRFRDETIELDMLGHGGSEIDVAYVVEIKSQLRDDGIDQLIEQLRRLPRLFPEHRGKKLYGILAALDIPAPMRARALREGFWLATITDDVFELVAPGDGFEPRAFGFRGLG